MTGTSTLKRPRSRSRSRSRRPKRLSPPSSTSSSTAPPTPSTSLPSSPPPPTDPSVAYQQLLSLFPTPIDRRPSAPPPLPPSTSLSPSTPPAPGEPTSTSTRQPPHHPTPHPTNDLIDDATADWPSPTGPLSPDSLDPDSVEDAAAALGRSPSSPSSSSSSSSPSPSSAASDASELLSADPFVSRFSHHRVLPASVIAALTSAPPPLTPHPPLPHLKETVLSLHLSLPPAPSPPPPLPLPTSPPTLSSLHIHPKLHPQWTSLTSRYQPPSSPTPSTPPTCPPPSSSPLTHPLHRWLLPLLTSYTDLVWGGVGWGVRAATTEALCLHCVNHVWKSRERVRGHDARLREWERREREREEGEREEKRRAKAEAKAKGQRKVHGRPPPAPLPPPPPAPPSYRDQGYTRCTVLYLLPLANLAYHAITTLLSLLPPSCTSTLLHHRRFLNDFAPTPEVQPDPSKPADFRALFSGQLNDAFRIGLAVGAKATTLYAPFTSADIVVASPLGLRMIVQEEGGDWLSSVELLVIDCAEVLSMQNWAHLQLLLPYINRMPGGERPEGGAKGEEGAVMREVDFSRVREYLLQGHARFYRQTIVLGSYLTQDMMSLVTGEAGGGEAGLRNYAGLVLLRPQYSGELSRLLLSGDRHRQVFHRFPSTFLTQYDDRFAHFTSTVLPAVRGAHEAEGHVLLFIPEYADFLRLRHHFQRRHLSYAAISEYSKAADLTRNRANFYHGRVKYLLITERLHYFRRYRIRGVRHVLFYSLPHNAHFYAEVANWMGSEPGQNGGEVERAVAGRSLCMCISLYTQWDARELERVVGTQRALKMMEVERSAYVFC